MNNKLLSVILVAGIASTGFAALSSADSTASLFGTGTQIESLLQKVSSGVTLTTEEQTTLGNIKTFFHNKSEKRGFDGHGKRAGFAKLTDEERTALKSMTDTEKQAFFDAKKAEMDTERTAHKAVIDKLIAGGTLTAADEATRLEMLSKFAEEDNDHPNRRDGGDIIGKLVAGDALSDAEKAELIQMQARHAEREAEKVKINGMSETEKQVYFEAKKAKMEAKMEIVKPLFEKLRSGVALSIEEQKTLGENMPEKGGKGGLGGCHKGKHHNKDMRGDDDIEDDGDMNDILESTEKTAQ